MIISVHVDEIPPKPIHLCVEVSNVYIVFVAD